MGYTTYFEGEIEIDPPLSVKELNYLNRFSASRRMDRKRGPYYIGNGDFGQAKEDDIIDYNRPPAEQPGLWCQWIASEDGEYIIWDDGEKFYKATEWMQYIIDHFLGHNPIAKQKHPDDFSFLQGHTLNGTIYAEGEEYDDHWKIVVKDNVVTHVSATVSVIYDDEK